jgi:sugar/nucleoside kinase (ribokinase family)
MGKSTYSVYGIGNPLLDFIAPVAPEALELLQAHRGTMNLVDEAGLERVLGVIGSYTNSPGGSCANTMRGISWLAQEGHTPGTAYSGAVGPDERGRRYLRSIEEAGVKSRLVVKGLPTGCSVILVTPDHERTMFTYLGACRQFEAGDLDFQVLGRSGCLYFTGYMWDTENQKRAVVEAASRARALGLPVCFDLADPFVVQRYAGQFLGWLPGRVDVLFGNREEFRLLFGEGLGDEALLQKVGSLCPTALMKVGCDGCYLYEGGRSQRVEGFCVKAVDTTAAGDCFAAGFLYGRALDLQPVVAARLGNRLAAAIVTVPGCDLSALERRTVLQEGIS